MSERLSDEELALLEYRANEIHVAHHTTATTMRRALAEIRAHRQAAITAEEREALRRFVSDCNSGDHAIGDHPIPSELALAAMTRLTTAKEM